MNILNIPILDEATIEHIVEITVKKLKEESEPKKDETLITTQEVCDEFRVSRITLNNYRKSGKLLPFSKSGKQHTYRRCDCMEAFRFKLKYLNSPS